MVEIINKKEGIQKIESQGKPKLIGVENCKSMSKVFEVLIAKEYKRGNLEQEFFLRGIYEKYKQFHPPKEKQEKVIKITLEGWKGEGQIGNRNN